MQMDKIKISNYHIEELPYFKEDDPNSNPYQDFYANVDLLQLVHKMSHIILKNPPKLYFDTYIPSDWHICHQFAFYYNIGSLLNDTIFIKRVSREELFKFCNISENDIEGHKEEIFHKIINKKIEICREFIKPQEDKQLNQYKDRFFTPDIIASLCAFNINIDQFWYMFLFTIDYIYRKTHNVTEYYPVALESFDELYSITSNIPEYDPTDLSINDASIVLRFGKQKLKIENPETIKLLGNIVHQFCEKHRNEHDEDFEWCSNEWLELNSRREKYKMTLSQMIGAEDFDGWKNIKALTRIYLFRQFMKEFFKDIKGKRNHIIKDFIEDAGNAENFAVSVDVELLITRLAWVADYIYTGLPNDKDYLKSLLKKFRPDENLNRGYYHWDISTY